MSSVINANQLSELDQNPPQGKKRSGSEGDDALVKFPEDHADKKLRSMAMPVAIQSIDPTRLDILHNEVILLKEVVNPDTSTMVDEGKKTSIRYDSPLQSFGGFSQVKSLHPTQGRSNGFTSKETERRKKNTSNYDKFFSSDKNVHNRKTIGERFKFKKKKMSSGVMSSAVKETYLMDEKLKYFNILNNINGSCSSHARVTSMLTGFSKPPILNLTHKTDLCKSQRKTEPFSFLTSTARKAAAPQQVLDSSGYNDSLETTKTPTQSPGFRNSLEESLKMKPVYSPNFLKELQEKYDRKSRETERKIAEEEIKKKFHEEKNKESKQSLEERILKHMEITQVDVEDIRELTQVEDTMSSEDDGEEEGDEDVEYTESSEEEEFSEEDEEEVELPEITPAMEEVILRAKRSRGEVLVDSHNIQITRKDIDTLTGLNWLNDEIINFYLQMIVKRSNQEGLKVYATSTFFYPKMMSHGQTALKRWTRKVDIFQQDLMLIPVHLGMHWCLAVVNFRKPGVYYYDSMGGNNTQCLTSLLKYLKDEYKDKKGGDLDMGTYEAKILKDIPQQMNGSDCGMFACKFAEYISRDAAITFNQEDMPYFRKRMIWEIVQDTLLNP